MVFSAILSWVNIFNFFLCVCGLYRDFPPAIQFDSSLFDSDRLERVVPVQAAAIASLVRSGQRRHRQQQAIVWKVHQKWRSQHQAFSKCHACRRMPSVRQGVESSCFWLGLFQVAVQYLFRKPYKCRLRVAPGLTRRLRRPFGGRAFCPHLVIALSQCSRLCWEGLLDLLNAHGDLRAHENELQNYF